MVEIGGMDKMFYIFMLSNTELQYSFLSSEEIMLTTTLSTLDLYHAIM